MPIGEKVFIGLSVADLTTTQYAMDNGYVEKNPLGQDDEFRVILTVGMGVWSHYLLKDCSGCWWWVVPFKAAPVMWNLYQLGK
jgi:hypothetical protein